MTGTISDKRLSQKGKDRALLLATGFNHGEDALDKTTAMIGLRAMRGTPPNHRVTQGAFGTVVGGLKAWNGDEAPEVGVSRQEQTTRRCGTRRGSGQTPRKLCRI